ncbi:MAG: site-specific integrase [Oscillospiraceae bacterium]|nr:site-specific integrase [Oscillospiraceae bacterium]
MATIQKRNGKYTVIYDYYKDGERKQKWKSCSDKKEAQRFKSQVENEKLNGNLIIPTTATLREFLAQWVDIYGKEKWQYKTYASNKCMIENHILPKLGDAQLANITPLMIEIFMRNLKNTRVLGSKSYNKEESETPLLSSTTARHIYFILKTAFDKAVEWQLIRSNPVICKAPLKLKSNRKAWDIGLVKSILGEIEHKQLHLAVHLAFICTLRIGEVTGLTWECVDFVNGKIYINKIMQRADKEALEEIPPTQLIKTFEPKRESKSLLILKSPKTEESIREIFITEPLKEELLERLSFVQRQKQFMADDYTDHDLVFTQDDGSPVEPALCEKWFKKWQSRTHLNVSGLIFHEIRHSGTTYKLKVSGGDIKSVQGDTGHASAKMVIDTYAHTRDENRISMMKQVEQDFYNNTSSESTVSYSPDENMNNFIAIIKSDPEMQQRFLSALING